MNWQMISIPSWWKQMFLFVLLDYFKIRTQTYASHLSKPLLPWRKLVGWYIILYCAKPDNPVDDSHSKMVETDVIARLVGLLQDQNSYVCQSSIGAITALATFGRLIYHFVLYEGWRSDRQFPLQDGGKKDHCSSCWTASRPGLWCTPVIDQSHYCLGDIR